MEHDQPKLLVVRSRRCRAIPAILLFRPPTSSPCLRASVVGFSDQCDQCSVVNSLLNSTTSSGQSFQLCFQHTITSHLSRRCLCFLKFRLSNSNSILTRCHTPGATSRMAMQSGKPACSRCTTNPSRRAIMPNTNTTPNSLVGSCASSGQGNGAPYTGRSRIIPPLRNLFSLLLCSCLPCSWMAGFAVAFAPAADLGVAAVFRACPFAIISSTSPHCVCSLRLSANLQKPSAVPDQLP